MGTKYAAVSVSGYNSSPPPDDGSVSAANRVDWSKVKTKIGDPLNVFAAAVDAAILEAFDYGATAITSSLALEAGHNAQFCEITTAVTVELPDAASMGASWHVYLKNSSSGTVTLTRASSGDTIDESASDSTLVANESKLIAVNAGLDGYIVLSGFNLKPIESFVVPISDETTAITTGTAKITMRMPYAFTLTSVKSSLTTASSSGLVTVDINEGGSSLLSTKLSIDANEKTSVTAATPAVISDSAIASDAEITFDIDAAGTNAAGLKVTLIGRQT